MISLPEPFSFRRRRDFGGARRGTRPEGRWGGADRPVQPRRHWHGSRSELEVTRCFDSPVSDRRNGKNRHVRLSIKRRRANKDVTPSLTGSPVKVSVFGGPPLMPIAPNTRPVGVMAAGSKERSP